MRSLSRTAAVAGAALLFAAAASAQASDVKEVHKTIALAKDGNLRVKTFKGSIAVTTWDRPEVEVDARIEPDGDDRESREEVQWTEVRISGGGRWAEIQSDYDEVKRHEHSFFGIFDGDHGSLPFVRYTIQMPATATLEIQDYKSETRLSDLKSDLRLNTYKGTVRVANLDGAARVETYKGNVQIQFARFSRASRFNTFKGEIEVRLPRDSRFELDADSGRRGHIDSDFSLVTHTGRWRGAREAGTVNGGGPELRLTTYKGSLRVHSN